jgi:hypothetical protein
MIYKIRGHGDVRKRQYLSILRPAEHEGESQKTISREAKSSEPSAHVGDLHRLDWTIARAGQTELAAPSGGWARCASTQCRSKTVAEACLPSEKRTGTSESRRLVQLGRSREGVNP